LAAKSLVFDTSTVSLAGFVEEYQARVRLVSSLPTPSTTPLKVAGLAPFALVAITVPVRAAAASETVAMPAAARRRVLSSFIEAVPFRVEGRDVEDGSPFRHPVTAG
jgi:hypothetical protein